MPIDLYYSAGSGHSQAVQMVAAALGVELNLLTFNMAAKEHLTPEFLAINPQHTVPTLNDNGFAVWETRAILTYLVEKYGPKNSPLYPSDDVQLRATINQRLYFDMGTLVDAFAKSYYPLFISGTPPTEESLKKVDIAFGFLDGFIGSADGFVAGNQLTVADFILFANTAIFEVVEYDFSRHANVSAWYKRLRASIPGEQINAAGMELARVRLEETKAKAKAALAIQ